MSFSLNVYDIVFIAALALSIISLIIAVILFFRDKIWLVFGYFTGIKTGKRTAGRVHMNTSSTSTPKQPKRVWKREDKKPDGPATVKLQEDGATVNLAQTDPPTVHLTQEDSPTEYLSQEDGPTVHLEYQEGQTCTLLEENDATAYLGNEGSTAVFSDAGDELLLDNDTPYMPNEQNLAANAARSFGGRIPNQAGSVPIDSAPEPSGGTVILRDVPAAAAESGGTVILPAETNSNFRITERIMLVFSEEVVL